MPCHKKKLKKKKKKTFKFTYRWMVWFFKIKFDTWLKKLSYRSKFQISVKSVKLFWCTKQFCLLQLQIMVTIIRHIFTDISQRKDFNCKIHVGYEKDIMGFLLIPKSQTNLKIMRKIYEHSFDTKISESLKNLIWKIRSGSFKCVMGCINVLWFAELLLWFCYIISFDLQVFHHLTLLV